MYIYNLNKTNNSSLPILDPDYNYDTLYSKENMRDFFKSIQKPEQTTFITGIYIQYHITPYLYENFTDFYYHFYQPIEDSIQEHFNFDYANLYSERSDSYFIVTFNITEQEISNAIDNLYQKLAHQTFTYHQNECEIQLKCGVYFSHVRINPFDFYQASKKQFDEILCKEQSFLSLQNLLMVR